MSQLALTLLPCFESQTPGEHDSHGDHHQKPDRPPQREEAQVVGTVSEVGTGVQEHTPYYIKHNDAPDETMPFAAMNDLFPRKESGCGGIGHWEHEEHVKGGGVDILEQEI